MGKFLNIFSLGQLIKKQRKSLGLTQAELAGLCNTGIRFIVDIENGKETAQIGKVFHVLQKLNLSVTIKDIYE